MPPAKEGPITEDIQVIGLGQACVDCLGRLTAYPEEDGKAELTDLHIQSGGPAATALVALARLGIRTSFLGSLSDDAWGITIIEGLKAEGVDCSLLKITPGYTSQFAFIAITKEGGNRTIFWHRGSVPHLKAVEYLHRLGPGEVVITLGTKGSIGVSGEEIIQQDAYKVDAVDTTGAGDVYHGAYVYGMLRVWGMGECMRFASAAAALKCRQIGAQRGIPRLEEVEGFLGKT
jgi:sugar/nucleoside kinase (ribokinase family)